MTKLQYITTGNTPEIHLQQVLQACNWGVKWIQLRMKDFSEEIIAETAINALKICKPFNCMLILNDFPQVAIDTGCDGVHVGQKDVPASVLKKILPSSMIFGVSTNNAEEISKAYNDGANYVGLGPFRYTQTKDHLRKVLGLDGIKQVLKATKEISIPIYAIGGIETTDIDTILKRGIYGIAVSGMLSKATNPEQIIQDFNTKYS